MSFAYPSIFSCDPRPLHSPVYTIHDVLPRPGGTKPAAPAALIDILAEVLIDGIVTIMRTALSDGDFKRGEHLKVLYGTYSHHGIYDGAGGVIHLSKETARVERTSLDQFRDGRCQVWVVASPKRHNGGQIVQRAQSKLGQGGYDLFGNNCEHFCNWCRSGRAASRQVDRWLKR